MKSPRMGRQLKILGSELEFADSNFMQAAYQRATSVTHGHLLSPLISAQLATIQYVSRPESVTSMRNCLNSRLRPNILAASRRTAK